MRAFVRKSLIVSKNFRISPIASIRRAALGRPHADQALVFHRYEWQDRAGTWQQDDYLWGGLVMRGSLLIRQSNGEVRH